MPPFSVPGQLALMNAKALTIRYPGGGGGGGGGGVVYRSQGTIIFFVKIQGSIIFFHHFQAQFLFRRF